MSSRTVPTRYDYYKARAREHRQLAARASNDDQRTMHERLVGAYMKLAQEHCLRQVLTLKVGGNAPQASAAAA